ncbi:alpha/beta fold hydrolase [Adhaeribacter aquaticus]|uniref:alpha/beta fold hydrolase n=1 Tax=Adhaeribacter aquaticus TaxID=299567 RepID=UPI0003F90A66|nr:alpha/beta fold hydrolase [Adhaeribacter aquaticus]
MPVEGIVENLHFTLFKPPNQEVKACVLILHGMKEHSGRYADFAHYLTVQGFAVLTYDHLGHGLTAKQADDLGFFHLQDPTALLVTNARQIADYLQNLYPQVPLFLLGHSMGSFVARCLLQQAGSGFAGAVLVGTGGYMDSAKVWQILFGFLNKIAPKQKSWLMNKGFRWINNLRFRNEKPNDGTNWLSVNKENRTNFLQDPLCGKDFTNNGFYTLLSLVVQATEKGWAKAIPKKLPLLFVSGEDDPIGNFGKGVRETVEALRQEGFENIVMKLYPGMRHEILNEEIKLQVYQDIERWLSAVVNLPLNKATDS